MNNKDKKIVEENNTVDCSVLHNPLNVAASLSKPFVGASLSKPFVGASLSKPEMKIRKNIRLKNYNYKSKGLYFITICTKDMVKIFGKIIDNKIILNKYGVELQSIIDSFFNDKYNIDCYQIMPNHIHLIIEIINDNEIELSRIVYHFKSKCTNLLKYKNLWQRNYYERIIRNEKEYYNIVRYIINNPYEQKYKW